MGQKNRPSERTKTGYKVPVPKRGEFMANLKKIAKKRSAPRSPKQ